MKGNFIKILSGLLLIATFISCDTENIGEIYTVKSDEPTGLGLLWATGNLKYTPDVAEASIPVVRVNAKGELTVPLLLTYDNTAFSIPTTVTFADGENQALIKFPLANAVLSKSYSITVNLDVDSAKLVKYGKYTTMANSKSVEKAIYGIKKATITLLKDYAWENIGQASLNSTWLTATKSVQVQKASGFSVYRVISAYGSNYNMLIKVNGNVATVERQQVGLESGVAPLFAQGSGTFSNKVFDLSLDFKMYYPTINDLYYQELGDIEKITLP